MNWEVFYSINKEFVNLLLLGFFYIIILGILFLTIRLMFNSIKEDDDRDEQ
jgi:hypothetical protein